MASNYTRKKIENFSYGLSDSIGKGYSSQVYRGRNDDTQENVAIKVIDLRMLKNEINRVLLDSEIQILKELKKQPHILNLYDVFTTKNNTYIVTELCDSDLSKLVKKGLTEHQACNYMQQILAGYLNFAKKQIIHRDLKPANILVTENEDLKIADFGFAIKTADAHKYSKYNVGSPLYMAPQSLKKNEYSLKTDIWALGVIFYELLTGQTPWKAKHQKELIKKIESEKAEDLINKLHVNTMAREFLKKSLKIDKVSRMDVDDLVAFNFEPQTVIQRPNILTEKKINMQLKGGNKDNRNFSIFSPKIDKSLENKLAFDRQGENRASTKDLKDLSQRKINTFRYDSVNKSVQAKANQLHKYNPSVTLELFKKEESISKENPQFTAPQPRTQTNEGDKKFDRRATSKILISQIHFCRFLYKLLTRIIQSRKNGLLHQIEEDVELVIYDYIGLIKHKIDNLLSFKSSNYINAANYEEYKQTSDHQKLMKIAKQYRERYLNQMKGYWNCSKCSFSTANTLSLIAAIQKLLQTKEEHERFTTSYEREIVILDYLMTSKQLIDIFQNGENYEIFAKKSRIEEIVQGKTAEISWDLYVKIINRSKELTEGRSKFPLKTETQQRGFLISA